ncbi:MAG: glycosyltransferase [Planctomycetota bacterium]|nr:glycosyltransferase [Planctomycetota bacterium]
MTHPILQVDVVVIGRDEGERLRRCFESVLAQKKDGVEPRLIYVDSGSKDGSVALAKRMGAEIVQLDMSTIFTAARSRNAGFACVTSDFVQFVDGDCELRDGWLRSAAEELEANDDVAVVFGRLRERHPEASLYNRLSDIEWGILLGDAPFCGGIAMMKSAAVREAGGFNESIRAGAEPELCERLRARGGRVRGIDAEMAYHDAAMTKFSQWRRRQIRAGYGMAQVTLRSQGGVGSFRKPLLSALAWSAGWCTLLLAAVVAGFALGGWWLWLPALPLAMMAGMVAKIARFGRRRGLTVREAIAYGSLSMLSKFGITRGALRYVRNHLLRRSESTIMYKAPSPGDAEAARDHDELEDAAAKQPAHAS